MSKLNHLLVLSVLFIAHLAGAAAFEGRFRLGSCNIDEFEGAERVYSRIGKSAWTPRDLTGSPMRLTSLQFEAYGSDASIMEIYFGSRAAMNAPGATGGVPYVWKTQVKANSIYSITTIESKRPSNPYKMTEETWIQDLGKKMMIQRVVFSSNPRESGTTRCELIRY